MEIPQKADVLLVLTDYYTYDMDPPAFPRDWWNEPPKTQSSCVEHPETLEPVTFPRSSFVHNERPWG
ncbi:hypothetical protein GCM10011363_30420 [Marivita lacus]|uniref:Uncharacterized protein n=1 Tax=Marivita lacus TaxID=1323742 RepID=A0ABQ1KWM8_9RHOB|nr:hypothetical protein [Marivita lacus]GGC11714.1 hypothetical protein GCM10011363_30420 [Marivita lacus]